MDTSTDAGLGGYFSIESVTGRSLPLLATAMRYQSARAAMAALLKFRQPKTVWLPHYMCNAVVDMLATINVNIQRYALSESSGVPNDLALESNDLLICVDFCGISAEACDAAIATYGSGRVLIDAAQSLFHVPRQGVSTIYSPRKFVGIPDGGLIVAHEDMPMPITACENASAARSRHLMTRAAGKVSEGYAQFQEAEASLSDSEPQAMSTLTTCMLVAIDFGQVRRRRISNFKTLSASLRSLGFNIPDLPEDAVPLCCPVLDVDGKSVQRKLISKNIFTPTYWASATPPDTDKVGLALRDRTIYLPCDQRYGSAEMAQIAHVMSTLKESQ